MIEFCQVGQQTVRVKGRVTGIPGGTKGIAILTNTGFCNYDKLPTDQYEHFNPLKSSSHGHRDNPNKHAGDLGNIQVGNDGVAVFDFTVPGITMESTPEYSIVNHTVVITNNPDDYGSNPHNLESLRTGNSGSALACGVISYPGMPATQPGINPNQYNQWDLDMFNRRDGYHDSNYQYPLNYQYPGWK